MVVEKNKIGFRLKRADISWLNSWNIPGYLKGANNSKEPLAQNRQEWFTGTGRLPVCAVQRLPPKPALALQP